MIGTEFCVFRIRPTGWVLLLYWCCLVVSCDVDEDIIMYRYVRGIIIRIGSMSKEHEYDIPSKVPRCQGAKSTLGITLSLLA